MMRSCKPSGKRDPNLERRYSLCGDAVSESAAHLKHALRRDAASRAGGADLPPTKSSGKHGRRLFSISSLLGAKTTPAAKPDNLVSCSTRETAARRPNPPRPRDAFRSRSVECLSEAPGAQQSQKFATLRRVGSWRLSSSQIDLSRNAPSDASEPKWKLLKQLGGKKDKSPQIKKILPPTAPDLYRHSIGSCTGSGFSESSANNSRGLSGNQDTSINCLPYSRCPVFFESDPVISNSSIYPCHIPSFVSTTAALPYMSRSQSHQSAFAFTAVQTQPLIHAHADDQGIDLSQSPGRESPGSSGSSSVGCLNSTTSLDSGKGSAATNLNRLSGQSYSSGSSQGSDRSEDKSSYISQVQIGDLLKRGMPDHEVLDLWLTDLHLDNYYNYFIKAGYDMQTIGQMTPQDLAAIGISNPAHRRKLTDEIIRLHLPDGLPEYMPNNLWDLLKLIGLTDYHQSLVERGCSTLEDAMKLPWEDMEEMGICLLGHQKKLMLAIKRLREIREGRRIRAEKISKLQQIQLTPLLCTKQQENYDFWTFSQDQDKPEFLSCWRNRINQDTVSPQNWQYYEKSGHSPPPPPAPHAYDTVSSIEKQPHVFKYANNNTTVRCQENFSLFPCKLPDNSCRSLSENVNKSIHTQNISNSHDCNKIKSPNSATSVSQIDPVTAIDSILLDLNSQLEELIQSEALQDTSCQYN